MRRRKFKLHSAFLDASMIGIYDSPVEFEVSIGNYGNRLDEYLPPCVCSTQPTNPVFDGSLIYVEFYLLNLKVINFGTIFFHSIFYLFYLLVINNRFYYLIRGEKLVFENN